MLSVFRSQFSCFRSGFVYRHCKFAYVIPELDKQPRLAKLLLMFLL